MERLAAWKEERKLIEEKYKSRLDTCEKDLHEQRQQAYKWRDETQEEWRAKFTPQQYVEVLSTLEENLKHRLDTADRLHRELISFVERDYREDLEKHNKSLDLIYQLPGGGPSISLQSPAPTDSLRSRGATASSLGETEDPVYKSGIKVEGSPGKSKRKLETPDLAAGLKRARTEISSASGSSGSRTSMPTPPSTTSPPTNLTLPKPVTNRTTTFHDVSTDPIHRDAIVEWPTGCGHFYILYCEKHQVHFTRWPTAGAAKHLNGKAHGHLPRQHDLAVKMLGYHVIDCNHELMRQHNEAVDRAYEKGYKPSNPELLKSVRAARKKEYEKASLASGHIPGTKTSGETTLADTSTSQGILDPKPFDVYCAYWTHTKETYPVIILGWDRQDEAGLGMTLGETGLIDPSAEPPECYIYDNGRIAGWAPGFEDGGPKARLRRFPVMWFDGCKSVGWVEARHLQELSSHTPKTKLRKFFKTARRWITNRQRSEHGQTQEGKNDSQNQPASSDAGKDQADLDPEDLELLRLAEKGGDDSNDESYEDPDSESGSRMEANRNLLGTTYRQSFYKFRSKDRAPTGPQETPAKPHATQRLDKSPVSAPRGVDSGRKPESPASATNNAQQLSVPHSTQTKPQQVTPTVQQPPPQNTQTHSDVAISSGPASFEITRYISGTMEWQSKPGEPCMQLFYSTDMGSVLSKGGHSRPSIRINTAELSGFLREEPDDGKSRNGILKLTFQDETKSPIKLEFERTEGSHVDIGKKQVRLFIAWLRSRGLKPTN